MEATAKLKGYPKSERKMRLIADLVRGKSVDEAMGILKHHKKDASRVISKLLVSAIANWEDKLNQMYDAAEYDLKIYEIFVDGGSMLKRFRPAPHGRAHRIRKRTCHVTLRIKNTVPLEDEKENSGQEMVAEENDQ